MKFVELLEAFEIEIKKLDDNLTKPTSSITEYFLNAGLDKYWKSRYSANNFKREAFELTEKRIDDLRTLIQNHTYQSTDITNTNNSLYTVTLPEDYILLLGDTAGIQPIDSTNVCWEKDNLGNYITHYSDTIEGNIDTIDRIKENSLSEYHLRYCKAKPIKLIQNNNIKLFTDGLYKINEYLIVYLRKPSKINIHVNPYEQYIDMPEHTQLEIIKMAALLYLENQSNPRYLTYNNEVNTME